MAIKRVIRPDSRLQIIGLGTPNARVKFNVEPNNIYVRQLNGDETITPLAEWFQRQSEHGFNVSEKLQNRLIKWVTGNTPDTSYYITLDFTNPLTGQSAIYYFMGIYGERVSFGAIGMQKLYTNRESAIKAAKRVKEIYEKHDIVVSVCQYRFTDKSKEVIYKI